jgi:ketosteroid isomerase-like protein
VAAAEREAESEVWAVAELQVRGAAGDVALAEAALRAAAEGAPGGGANNARFRVRSFLRQTHRCRGQ